MCASMLRTCYILEFAIDVVETCERLVVPFHFVSASVMHRLQLKLQTCRMLSLNQCANQHNVLLRIRIAVRST